MSIFPARTARKASRAVYAYAMYAILCYQIKVMIEHHKMSEAWKATRYKRRLSKILHK